MVPLVPPHHYSLFNSVVMSSDFQSSWSVDNKEFVHQVHRAYFELLYFQAKSLCSGSSIHPDDLLQDLFLKIAQHPNQFREQLETEKGLNYLRASLRNRFLDLCRSDKSRRQNEQMFGAQRTGQTSLYAHCPDTHQKHIEHFLALTLKGRELEIMILYSQGFKYREIAEILDMKTSTVGASITRSKDKLAKALESDDMDQFKNIDIEKWRRKKPRRPELFDEEE